MLVSAGFAASLVAASVLGQCAMMPVTLARVGTVLVQFALLIQMLWLAGLWRAALAQGRACLFTVCCASLAWRQTVWRRLHAVSVPHTARLPFVAVLELGLLACCFVFLSRPTQELQDGDLRSRCIARLDLSEMMVLSGITLVMTLAALCWPRPWEELPPDTGNNPWFGSMDGPLMSTARWWVSGGAEAFDREHPECCAEMQRHRGVVPELWHHRTLKDTLDTMTLTKRALQQELQGLCLLSRKGRGSAQGPGVHLPGVIIARIA